MLEELQDGSWAPVVSRCLVCDKKPDRQVGNGMVWGEPSKGFSFDIAEWIKLPPGVPHKAWLCFECWIGGIIMASQLSRSRGLRMVKDGEE